MEKLNKKAQQPATVLTTIPGKKRKYNDFMADYKPEMMVEVEAET